MHNNAIHMLGSDEKTNPLVLTVCADYTKSSENCTRKKHTEHKRMSWTGPNRSRRITVSMYSSSLGHESQDARQKAPSTYMTKQPFDHEHKRQSSTFDPSVEFASAIAAASDSSSGVRNLASELRGLRRRSGFVDCNTKHDMLL